MPPNAPTPTARTTRERILAYLEENPVASVQALSRAWGLTRADIRYHMRSLMEDGLIEQISRDPSQPAPRGRPELFYRLADRAKPDPLAALCVALLDLVFSQSPEDAHATRLRLAERLAGDQRPAGTMMQRYNQTVQFLNQRGYHARWEAYASGPRILLRRCPFAAVLADHPELCQVDLALLETLVQVPLQQTCHIDWVKGKPPACIFTPR